MIRSYEARYEKGRLKWIAEAPEIDDGEKILVIVEKPVFHKSLKEEIHKVLVETRGAWGSDRSLAEIDREINTIRSADWKRKTQI